MRKLVGSLAVAGVLVVAACASAEQAGETGTVGPAVVSWVDTPCTAVRRADADSDHLPDRRAAVPHFGSDRVSG
jgi:hypothetical protein